MHMHAGDRECTLTVQSVSHGGVRCLMCAAVDFHGLVKYQWFKDETELPTESHCILYITQPAHYSCVVYSPGGSKFPVTASFKVKCNYHPYMSTYHIHVCIHAYLCIICTQVSLDSFSCFFFTQHQDAKS